MRTLQEIVDEYNELPVFPFGASVQVVRALVRGEPPEVLDDAHERLREYLIDYLCTYHEGRDSTIPEPTPEETRIATERLLELDREWATGLKN